MADNSIDRSICFICGNKRIEVNVLKKLMEESVKAMGDVLEDHDINQPTDNNSKYRKLRKVMDKNIKALDTFE